MEEETSGQGGLHSEFDLDSIELDMNRVPVEDQELGRYSFVVPDRKTGRKIGYEIGRTLNLSPRLLDGLKKPEIIEDLRLNGNQLSFSEYEDEEDELVVQIYLRYPNQNRILLSDFVDAVDSLRGKDIELMDERAVFLSLGKLKEMNVMQFLRLSVIDSGTIFDSKEGYVADEDESETSNVLDMYRDSILNGAENDLVGLYTEVDRQHMIDALAPNSKTRKVLLAYWQVEENTPWRVASERIRNKVDYRQEDFPTQTDISLVLKQVNEDAAN